MNRVWEKILHFLLVCPLTRFIGVKIINSWSYKKGWRYKVAWNMQPHLVQHCRAQICGHCQWAILPVETHPSCEIVLAAQKMSDDELIRKYQSLGRNDETWRCAIESELFRRDLLEYIQGYSEEET